MSQEPTTGKSTGERLRVWTSALLLTGLMLYGLGYLHINDAESAMRRLLLAALTCGFYLYSARRGWATRWACGISLLFSLYVMLGIGRGYGYPTTVLAASALETDVQESWEFLLNLDVTDIALGLVAAALAIFYGRQRTQVPRRFSAVLWVVLAILNVFGLFTVQAVKSVVKYRSEHAVLEAKPGAVDWQIERVERNRNLKVLVIGESVNRRYMSVMGSPWKTTPFLDASPQVAAYAQYHAPAPNTVTSLVRTLSYSTMADGSFDPDRNVMALAHAAGYTAHWISNQGSVGKHDTKIAWIARQADSYRFLDQPPAVAPYRDDFAMLNMLRSQLETPGTIAPDAVIVLHMMGSHPDACERVTDMPIAFQSGQGHHIDCYLTSLRKLDLFLQKLDELLQTWRPDQHEILFVSDHSLRVEPASDWERWKEQLHMPNKNIYVEPNIQEAYDTALLHIDTGRKEAMRNTTPISGYDFFHLYANWLGVKSPMVQPGKNLAAPTSSAPIQVYNWQRMVPWSELPDAPVFAPAQADGKGSAVSAAAPAR